MKRLSLALISVAFAAPAVAQTRSEPNLVLTIFAGVTAGHSLWSVDGQAYCSAASCTPATPHDTLRLSRDITSGITAGLTASYFGTPHFGLLAELFYLGLSFEDHCEDLFASGDARNAEICARANTSALSTSAIGFFAGAVLRAAPRGSLSPYLRGGVGLTTYSGGTVEMTGCYVSASGICQQQAILIDPDPKTAGLSFEIGAGLVSRLGPGYQFRFDVRDVIAPLELVTGPAPSNLVPPTATRYFHHFGLTLGLEVILEKKRGRRY